MTVTWQTQIRECFGLADRSFASHLAEEKRARETIAAAKEAGASQEDFLKEMVWYIYRNVVAGTVRDNLFEKSEKRLKRLW